MGKLQTEGALETVTAIASESVACVEIIKKVRAASRGVFAKALFELFERVLSRRTSREARSASAAGADWWHTVSAGHSLPIPELCGPV